MANKGQFRSIFKELFGINIADPGLRSYEGFSDLAILPVGSALFYKVRPAHLSLKRGITQTPKVLVINQPRLSFAANMCSKTSPSGALGAGFKSSPDWVEFYIALAT